MVEANAIVKIDNRIIPLTESTDLLASHPDNLIFIDFMDTESKKDKQRASFSSPQPKPLLPPAQADSQILRVFIFELV